MYSTLILVLFCATAVLSAKADKDNKKVKVEDAPITSSLLAAAAAGNVQDIEVALAKGDNIDTKNVNGWSSAMFAVANGDMQSLDKLISMGIDLNGADINGVTPLMMASSQSDKEMVELLIAGNASPLLKANDGTTAYTKAVDSGRKVVALLIAESAVLHGIEMGNQSAQIEYLKHGAYVNIRNGAGYTPIIAAASVGNLAAVKELILMGADCNRQENDGWAAIHFAAVRGDELVVKALLEANAAPGIVTEDGRTARSIAETAGHRSILDIVPDVTEMSM
jgi:ankyrin repeat protein